MIIKKFQAKTEAEATALAQKELGEGIVIMNVKVVKPEGLKRFFKGKLTEVTVALEDESDRPVIRTVPREPEPKIPAAENRKIPAQIISEPSEPEHAAPVTNSPGNRLEKQLDNLQDFLEKKLQPEKPAEEPEEPAKDDETVAFVKLLYNIMLDNEVNERYANQIIDEIDKSRKDVQMDYVLAGIYQKMILKFGESSYITPSSTGPRIVFFVGPTGVGKTTTIAKLASKFCLEEKRKVALLTADTYRIAASEQLHTYANILNVPFRVIYSTDDMELALKDLADFDYILIDTAGHSHNNEEQKETMTRFVHCADGSYEKEVYLVLSATTKYKDLICIADAYRDMADYKLIFTKLDETVTLGNLFNLRLYTNAPMSYVTCGQNVPNDIELFNPQKTVKRLLGGKK